MNHENTPYIPAENPNILQPAERLPTDLDPDYEAEYDRLDKQAALNPTQIHAEVRQSLGMPPLTDAMPSQSPTAPAAHDTASPKTKVPKTRSRRGLSGRQLLIADEPTAHIRRQTRS